MEAPVPRCEPSPTSRVLPSSERQPAPLRCLTGVDDDTHVAEAPERQEASPADFVRRRITGLKVVSSRGLWQSATSIDVSLHDSLCVQHPTHTTRLVGETSPPSDTLSRAPVGRHTGIPNEAPSTSGRGLIASPRALLPHTKALHVVVNGSHTVNASQMSRISCT